MSISRRNQARLLAAAAGVALAVGVESGRAEAETPAETAGVEQNVDQGVAAPAVDASGGDESTVAMEPAADTGESLQAGLDPSSPSAGSVDPAGEPAGTGVVLPDSGGVDHAGSVPGATVDDGGVDLDVDVDSASAPAKTLGAASSLSLDDAGSVTLPVLPEMSSAPVSSVVPVELSGAVPLEVSARPVKAASVLDRISVVLPVLGGPFAPGNGGPEGPGLSVLASLWFAGRSRAFVGNHTPVAGTPSGTYVPVIGQSTGQLNFTDADGDKLSYRVTTAPKYGTVTVNADGSYTYVANEDVRRTGGTDSFTVEASDASYAHVHGGLLDLIFGRSGSHTASQTVTVTVTPSTSDQVFTLPGEATAVAVSPDGKTLYITADEWRGSVGPYPLGDTVLYVVDAESGELLDRLFMWENVEGWNDYASHVTVTADGKTVIVERAGSFTFVDTETLDMRTVEVANGGENKQNSVTSSDGTKIYALVMSNSCSSDEDCGARTIRVVDVSQGTVVDEYSAGSAPELWFDSTIGISADGQTLYVGGDGTISAYSAATGQLTGSVAAPGNYSIGQFSSPDGRVLFAVAATVDVDDYEQSAPKISVIDAETMTVTATYDLPAGIYGYFTTPAVLSADGNSLFIAAITKDDGGQYQSGYVVFDTTTNSVSGFQPGGLPAAYSPDGSTVYTMNGNKVTAHHGAPAGQRQVATSA